MRISDHTRFPHPVLAADTGDFLSGRFEVRLSIEENLESGALRLNHQISLTEDGIKRLVETGKASAGCFVRCRSTYYSELRKLSWPEGSSDFAAGRLLHRVSLRPLIWLNEDLNGWDTGTIHQEFNPPVSLRHGEVIAVAAEQVISVGRAKLSSIETIFELNQSPDVPDGQIRVELDGDRVSILAAPDIYKAIGLLREQQAGKPTVMNGVYFPAVIETLDALRGGLEQYEGRRWYRTFMAKCDAAGIDLTIENSVLEDAQRLLHSPLGSLSTLIMEPE